MDKRNALSSYLEALGPAAVAVSGGVDSMTLAVLAHRVNREIVIFHAVSPAVPGQATDRVKHYARQENWQLEIIDAGEIEDPEYLANPANRCYFCKTNLYDTIVSQTEKTVLSGTNLDDLGDYRPGLEAAREHQVKHPYVEVGIDKRELRAIAKQLGLEDLHDLPAAPCLSSRVETGIAINPAVLPVINETEQALWESLQLSIPVKGVRCRVRQNGLALEIETQADIDPTADYALDAVKLAGNIFSEQGFANYTASITVEPYRRGSAFLIDTLALD